MRCSILPGWAPVKSCRSWRAQISGAWCTCPVIPGALARDVGTLVNELGFELLAAGVADMFPQTSHVESVAVLAPKARK